MSRIAVIGAGGQLGTDLVARLGSMAIPVDHATLDITDAAQVRTVLESLAPTAVINCAAYNLVDRAESEPDAAFLVNRTGVLNLATWCREFDIPLMQISTDHVFGVSGERSTPWCETDEPMPLSMYARSKYEGELVAGQLCPRGWIVRTCGLYGRRATRSKGNFVDTMLRLGAERETVRVVSDQRCTPTSTRDLAELLAQLVQTTDYGLVHITNTGDCSWHEFATEIFRLAGFSTVVEPITSAEFNAPAARPRYSVLDTRRVSEILGITPRPWQQALAEYLADRPTPA